MAEKIKLVLIGIFIALFSASPSGAVISESDDPSYTLMATGINYTAYFSPMNTNGFKFVINDHSIIFLPRSISYTDEGGETTQHLGSAQDTQIQNTSDMIYFDNAYGLGGRLSYLSNPLMIKEVYTLNELPAPSSNNDWMTLSSIAAFGNDLKLKYIDDSGVEKSWDGTKIKTNEIKFYDAFDKFQFELPQPIAKDALNSTESGHYIIYEKEGILYISARFSYASLANMTLPIYLDISLAEGKVAFGDSEYLIGETLEIWARGFAFSNERTLLYNPSNQVVATFDWPSYADGWTSKYTYVSDVNISPKTLNINSSGNWITGFIELPSYSPESIDISTLLLNDAIRAEARPFGIDDHNENGMPDLMVKFNRSEVQKIVQIGDATFYITGKVNGAAFTGGTLVRVIEGAGIGETNGNKGKGKE